MVRARDNPFRVQRITALPFRLPAGESWEGLLSRLASLAFRAALVGPEGRGKSTLLRQLARRLEEAGFQVRALKMRRGQGRLSRQQEELLAGLSPRDLVTADGVDQLGWLARRRLLARSRAGGGLLVTSHRPLALPTLLACQTSPELFADILAELVPGAPLPPHLSPESLWARHRGNLREALWELYERWGELA